MANQKDTNENGIQDDLIEALDLGGMTREMQDTIIDRAGELIFRAVLMRGGGSLDKDMQKELGELMDADAPFDELILFLEANVPNFDRIVMEEGGKVREELLTAQ